MAKATVHAGVCGFTTVIDAESDDGQDVTLQIHTDCPNYKPLEGKTCEADAFEACFAKVGEGFAYELCRPYCKHAACPVPAGIIKAIEAACGLALPREARIEVEK